MSDEGQNEADRRSDRRARALLGGKVVVGDGLSWDCVIRDITAAGARITTPLDHQPPDSFVLIDVKGGMAHDARVVWRHPPLTGLHFDRSTDLKDARTDAPYYLRQLWMACAPR